MLYPVRERLMKREGKPVVPNAVDKTYKVRIHHQIQQCGDYKCLWKEQYIIKPKFEMCLRNNGFFKETFLQSLVAPTSRESWVKIIWGVFVCFSVLRQQKQQKENFLIFKLFYCCLIRVVCIFSPPLYPPPAKHNSLPCFHPPPWFCPCSFIVVPENPSPHCPFPAPLWLLLDCS